MSNKQFYKFLKEASKLFNITIGDDLVNKVYSYFKSDGSIKNMNRWRIIRLMQKYNFTTWDKFSAAIRKFNEKYALDPKGKPHKNDETKIQEATQQMYKQAEEEADKENNQNKFKNVIQDIKQKAEAVKQILKPIEENNKTDFDLSKEEEYIKLLSDPKNYEKGILIWFRKDKNIKKKVRFSVIKKPLIKFLDNIKDYSKWYCLVKDN